MRIALKSKMDVSMVIVVLTAAMLLIGGATVIGDDWPNYRGPNHDGISAETSWKADWGASGPKKLWTKSIGVGFSSIVVSNGRAYMTGNSGEKSGAKDTVFCLDANTGKEIWKHTYPCPLQPKHYEGGTLSTPTVDGKVVYTLSKMGDLFCLDADTGKVIWNKQVNKEYGFELPTWHFSGSPLVSGDVVYFNLGTAGAAIDKKTGKLLWDNGKEACGYATPVPYTIGGQKCLAIFGSEAIKAVMLTDGKPLWEYPVVNRYKVNAADPIPLGNDVFFSSGYGRGSARITIAGGNAKKIWDNRAICTRTNCSVYWKGHVYGFDESSNLKCVDLKDGSLKWSEEGLGTGALMMSNDGRMIIMSDRGELVIAKAEPKGFKAAARAQILPRSKCWTVPVLANGKIYARNAAGDMVCVDVSAK